MRFSQPLKAIVLATLLTSVNSAFALDVNDKAEIEKVIEEYVMEHPDLILRAIKKLEEQEYLQVENARAKIASDLINDKSIPSLGKDEAEHYIIEFYDYNCGYCKVMEPLFKRALGEYDLKVVYVNIPVVKEESKQLALLGQAIYNLDKEKYFKFHEHYMQAGRIPSTKADIEKVLSDIGLDYKVVDEELKSGKAAAIINSNIQKSMQLKVAGTPYLIIDGKEYRGAITSFDALAQILGK